MAQLNRRKFGSALLAGAGASTFGRLLSAQENCAPPVGTPVDFVVPNLQTIERKSVAELTTDEVARLRLAYQKLRDLTVADPKDPRGWMQQAHVHCWNCGGSDSDIHGSWTFLPWHRAYLYFHERILCTLLNDDSFRLPYWSWDDTDYRSLPETYQSAKVGDATNSLYDANRSREAVSGASMDASIFPASQNPMNSGNFTAFGGDSEGGGSLEFGPHGAVHNWVGLSQSPNADMGNLLLAARDPIFFVHHCNIDRLWAEFNRRNPASHANPTDPDFLTRSFQFFDENKQLVTIRVQDVLDTAPLGFAYRPDVKLSNPNPKPPKWTQLKYDPIKHLIRLPAPIPQSPIVPQRSLVVKGVKLPMKSGSYNVYVGNPPASGGDQSKAANYVGYIGIIVSGHAHNQKCSLVLDPTNLFLDRAGGAGAMLTFAAAGTTKGAELEFAHAYLTEQ